MRCWNCDKKIPDKAKICQFCESDTSRRPTAADMDGVQDLLGAMPPEAIAELHSVFAESKTAEEAANRILVGDCPRCGSVDTGDCESDPEIEDFVVGRCYQCGQLFCTECRRLLEPESPECPCWDEE